MVMADKATSSSSFISSSSSFASSSVLLLAVQENRAGHGGRLADLVDEVTCRGEERGGEEMEERDE